MRITGKILFGICSALALMLAACDNGYDCSINNVAYNRIGFYSGSEKYEFPEPLGISLVVNGSDSIITPDAQGEEEIELPMSYTHECDTVVFRYSGNIADTIFVGHKNIVYYQSMECGTVMYHRISEVHHTGALIDSVAIVHNFVNFDANENLRIYFAQ